MRVDWHTLRDLEVLVTPSGAPALLDRLDRTRTRPGREALRRRLTHPLGSLAEIGAVQESLRYIRAQRAAFDRLPRDSDVLAVKRYLESGYAVLGSTAGPALTVESWWIRVRYRDVFQLARAGVRQVEVVLERLDALQSELSPPPSSLARLLEDVRGILDEPGIRRIRTPRRRFESPAALLLRDHAARETSRDQLRRLLEISAELDALTSMSDSTFEREFSFPVLEEGHRGVECQGLYHPFLEHPVANELALTAASRLLFLTGPNMAGKTTFLKAAGIAVLLAHTGMGVPARACRLSVLDHLITAIRTEDNLAEGVSYFQAEARRVREMSAALAAGARCLLIVDELFRGTNVKDAFDASATVLRSFAGAERGLFIVASHLIELAGEIERLPGIVLRRFEAVLGAETVQFDYQLETGVSAQRLGMMVLEREGVLDALGAIRAAAASRERPGPAPAEQAGSTAASRPRGTGV